jgi:hypothetical protein
MVGRSPPGIADGVKLIEAVKDLVPGRLVRCLGRGSLLHLAIDLWQTCDVPRMGIMPFESFGDHCARRRLLVAPGRNVAGMCKPCVMATIQERRSPQAEVSESMTGRQDRVWKVLPQAAWLIAAFPAGASRGHPGQFVIDIAHELAAQHEQQWRTEDASRAEGVSAEVVASCKRLIDGFNARRVMLVEQIDDRVMREIGGQADVSLHTETFGSVVDRMAIAWVRVNSLLGAGAGDQARLALRQLTELAAAYDDLVRDVALGRRRLPSWRSLKSYRGGP